jgi:hypothetical protein
MESSLRSTFWLFAMVGTLFIAGCEPQKETTIEDLEEATEEASEQKEEAKEAEQELSKAKSEFEQTQERDDYVQAKEKDLVEADTTLQQLKDKSTQLQGPEQQNLTTKIGTVEAKRDAAKEHLDEIREADPAKWKGMQESTDKAFADLKQSISDAELTPSQPNRPPTPRTTQPDASTTNDATQPQAEPSQSGQIPSQE